MARAALALALSCGGRAWDGDGGLPSPGSQAGGGAIGAGAGGNGGGPSRGGPGSGGSGAAGTGSGGTISASPSPMPIPEAAPDVGQDACPVGNAYDVLEIRSQDELEALRRCSRIEGDLAIYPFDGADLTALAALARVGGTLTLGDPYSEPPPLGFSSLRGLESLRTLGGLSLRGVGAASLEALSGLRELGASTGVAPISGFLFIDSCPLLTDLRGLENLEGLQGFIAKSSPRLVSVAGLRVPSTLSQFEIWDSPVSDISALAALTTVNNTLWFINTALTNVVDLGRVTRVDQVQFWKNAALVDLAGLAGLSSVRYLNILENSSLQSLPVFAQLSNMEGLFVDGNAALGEVGAMPALRSVHSAGFTNNPMLSRVAALGAVQRAVELYVDRNPSLIELDLGRLAKVEGLFRVSHNPALDSSGVPRPEGSTLVVGGNLGEELGLDPCPWSGNLYCEGPPNDDLCALGADSDCPSL